MGEGSLFKVDPRKHKCRRMENEVRKGEEPIKGVFMNKQVTAVSQLDSVPLGTLQESEWVGDAGHLFINSSFVLVDVCP